jgi:mRNA interferase RelE/StbE
MSYTVEYELEALISLEKLDPTISQRILNKINWLAENFELITPQPLTGDLVGLYKLRVGDYRVIYDFNNQDNVITIDKIGHRREIYQ